MLLDRTNIRPRHPAPQYYYMRVHENAPSKDTSEHRFDVTDLSAISSHVDNFSQSFPRIQPVYPVDLQKNADASLIASLHESGCTLNLNSIDAVRLAADCIGDLSDCCFSSPVKPRLHIMEAISLGINRMTVAFPCEVMRISSFSKKVELILRISPTEDAADRPNGASKSKWREILAVAKAKGMKIFGIAIQTKWDKEAIQDSSSMTMAALARAQEAYELATEYGHEVALIDVGNLVARNFLHQVSHHERCSTIVEELSEDDEEDGDLCPTELTAQDAADQNPITSYANALLEHHFPRSLRLRILAEHAQYVVPDEGLLKKWWGTPKMRRPTPSLHTYLTSGCSSNAAYRYTNAYRSSKMKCMTPQDIVNEMEPAAAQA